MEPTYGFGAGAGGVGLIVLFLHMLVWGMDNSLLNLGVGVMANKSV
jgi:hypothetical protein